MIKKESFFSSTHKENIKLWQKMQDAFDGEYAIKQHDKTLFEESNVDRDVMFDFYLPPLRGMLTDEYAKERFYEYLLYAVWYAAFGRTINEYVNMLTAKNPVMNIPDNIKEKASKKDGSFLNVIKYIATQVLLKNRVGVLIDAPNVPENMRLSEITVQQAIDFELRPFISLYDAESIIYNNDTGDYVVLFEIVKERITVDGFQTEKEVEQYRVLDIYKGKYRQRVVRFKEEKYVVVSEVYPVINGRNLNFIPFYCITDSGITWKYDKPFTEDLVNLNIAHFRNSASYEKGLLLTASPTYVIKGNLLAEESQEKGLPPKGLKLGSGTVLRLTKDSDAGFIEYSGAGIASIKDAMSAKETLMARLGADVLDTGKAGVESAEALGLKGKSENSLLGSLSVSLSESLTKIARDFFGESAEIILNKDFDLTKMDPASLSAIGNELIAGHISWETYFYNIQKGEIVPPNVTADEEKQKILGDQIIPEMKEGLVETADTGTIDEPTNQVQLNGAQVASATAIAKSVVAGEIPRAAALEQLQILFNMDLATAERFMSGIV